MGALLTTCLDINIKRSTTIAPFYLSGITIQALTILPEARTMQASFKRMSGEQDEMPALVHLRCCRTGPHQKEHCMQGSTRSAPSQRDTRAHLRLPPRLTCPVQWLQR